MGSFARRSLVLLGIAATASVARAEDYEAHGGTERTYAHRGQVKIYSQLGDSYRVIFRYDESHFCGQAGKAVCHNFSPAWLELGLGYGITNSFEVMTDIRFSLGGDFVPASSPADAPGILVISPGVRMFIDDAGSLKVFSTFQLAIDRTDYSGSGVTKKTDVAFRNVNGLLVDLHRTIGIYVHIGETIGFVRWLRFEIDAGIGMMVRVP